MPRMRMPFVKDFFVVIRPAAISEKLKNPITQVKANRQKQTVIKKITIVSKMPVPGVSAEAEVRNLGSLSSSIQTAPPSPLQR